MQDSVRVVKVEGVDEDVVIITSSVLYSPFDDYRHPKVAVQTSLFPKTGHVFHSNAKSLPATAKVLCSCAWGDCDQASDVLRFAEKNIQKGLDKLAELAKNVEATDAG